MDNDNNCVTISEAILARGINDVTSWLTVQIAFSLVYGILMLIGILFNAGVLCSFLRNKRLRSARNIFSLNLIITDLLLCVTAIPVTPWYALTKDWSFGAVMCRLMPLSNSCSVFVTSWSLTAIAIDKCVHIRDATRAPLSARQASLITSFIWLISTLINVPYLMSFELVDGSYYVQKGSRPFCGQFCDEINWHGEVPRRLYGSAVVLLQFVVPMAIITYCYVRILEKVAKDMIVHNVQFSKSLSNTQRLEATNRIKRVNYILIAMVLAFIGCWLPITVVNILKDFKREPTFLLKQPFFWPLVAHLIAMSTVFWNPLLFFWLTRRPSKKATINFHLSASIDALSSMLRRNSVHRQSTLYSTQSAQFPSYASSQRYQQRPMSRFSAHKLKRVAGDAGGDPTKVKLGNGSGRYLSLPAEIEHLI